jgi:lysozyme
VPAINDVFSLLRFEEGDRLFVYDDATGKPITKGSTVIGNPTIGVGRNLASNGISQDESDAMLTHDVQRWTLGLSKCAWFNNLDNVRKAAIVSMTHVVGLAGIQEFHDMIAALSVQDWTNASTAALASEFAARDPQRAKRCAVMLLTGQWPVV